MARDWVWSAGMHDAGSSRRRLPKRETTKHPGSKASVAQRKAKRKRREKSR